MLRTLILGLMIVGGAGWGLVSALGALLFFNWITFMRPQDFDWGFWSDKPLFQLASLILLGSNLIRGRLGLRFTPFLALYLIFFAWVVMGCIFAYNPQISWAYFKAFLIPFPILFIILTASVKTLEEMKWVLWLMAGSVGLVAFKTGLVFTAKGGGHITDQINGFVGDNNVLALSVCLVLATLMGLRSTLPKKKQYHIVFYFIISQVLLTVLYTQSRGAFITLGMMLLIGSSLSKKPVRNVTILLVVVLVGYLALPKEMFSRLDTLNNLGEDSSAMGRVEMWKKAMQQASMRPVFGVGIGGFANFNISYWPEEFIDGHSLVTHSVYFQVLSTTGFGGLAIYLSILGVTFWNLHSAYRLASRNKGKYPALAWAGSTAFWMRNGFVSYAVGSGFLDMLIYDVPWYFMLYASLLNLSVRRELGRLRRQEKKSNGKAKHDLASDAGPAAGVENAGF